ncbi:Insulin-degrading enzyme [Blattella germanica]|nr:Insulin-degrading enzyme [Blattella germanica]
MAGVKRRVDNIIKSAEDKRLYRSLELQNDMKVLLISDSGTDKSAASLDVNIGHMSDPSHLPGLAHFCEHMLFLGTEKYPSENEYSKFLSEHGGGSNACTYSDHTNYYFDVVPEHLPGALDRFAQFFLCPLFTESATEREVNAVNSEHEKNIPNDSWRLDQLEKSTAKKDHAFNKFGTGNKQTLDISPKENGINVREELLKFHDTWYSSNIMALAVLGKESLDDLEKIVVELFSDVKNKSVTAPEWTDHPFGPEQLQMKGFIVPVKDLRNLNITFPIPDLHQYYKSGPGHYLSHLFGHEGPGSLLSVLRAKGWCNSLVGGARTGSRGFGFFGINVDLTEEGIDHVDDIVKLVFQYVNMLKKEGPMEWIFEEYKDIDYPLEEVLSGCFLLSDWRPDLIEMVLGYLTPENIRVAVVGQKFEPETTEIEKWYGTKYKLEKIPDTEWRSSDLCDDLKLPPKNEFIPTDFDLMAQEENAPTYPMIIQDTPLSRVWFKQDDEFLLPKANLSFEFVSPLAYLDPVSCNMTYMFVQLFKDALNEYAYAAELAGMRWELTNTKYGMILGIGGYNSKQHVLLDKIMEKLTNFKIDAKRFEILKENLGIGGYNSKQHVLLDKIMEKLTNFKIDAKRFEILKENHAVYYLAVLLAEQAWTKEELLAATDELTLEKVDAFIPQILSKMHIECLIHGNADKQVIDIGKESPPSCTPRRGEVKVVCVLMTITAPPASAQQRTPAGCHYVFEVRNRLHRSSCTEIYYQCNLQCIHTNMLLELLVQLINEPCFNILRTKEQLGYIVFSGIRRSNGVQGLRVIVQSDRHPSYVDQRVEAFLSKMEDYIGNMSSEEFERHKEALAAQRLEKPKKLSVLSARFWSEITTQQYNFDRANIEVAHLRELQKKDILEFFKARREVHLHVISKGELDM